MPNMVGIKLYKFSQQRIIMDIYLTPEISGYMEFAEVTDFFE